MKKRVKRFFSVLFLIFILLLLLYIVLTVVENRDKLEFGEGIGIRIKSEPQTTITVEWIEQEISTISEYATLEYRYTNVSNFENQKDFYGWRLPFTNKNFVVSYDGLMKIGIDASLIKVEIIGENNIAITIPDAKVLSHVIQEDSIEVFDQSANIFNPIKITDYTSFATEQKKTMEEKATEEGVLAQATDNAKKQIQGFVEKLPGIEGKYTVTIVGGSAVAPGSTSSPGGLFASSEETPSSAA